MRSLAAASLILVSSHAPAADLVSAVPDRFVGEWNASLSDCGTDRNDSRLRIEKSHITYWESDGPVKAVVSEGRYEIALILHLSGEGETWIATEHFKLSENGEELTSVNLPGEGFVRRRCPRSQLPPTSASGR